MKLMNCKCKWAKLQVPDEMSGAWSIDLYPDPATIEKLKAEGVGLKTFAETGEIYVTCKRKKQTTKGTTMQPPMVIDAHKQPFAKLIGNGSVVNVIAAPYDWTFGGKTGKSLWLEGVQVVTLIEYNGGEAFDEIDAPVAPGETEDVF